MKESNNVSQEERENIDAMTFCFFEEYIDKMAELGKMPSEEKAVLERFGKIMGCAPDSPLALMFAAYREGIGKGVELWERICALQ